MSQNHEHSYINILAKYLILTGIVYIVAMISSNKLIKMNY